MRREQFVRPAARAVSRLLVVEVHFTVVVHRWADTPCVSDMGLERVPDGER